MSDASERFEVVDGVITEEVDGELVLLDMARDACFGLNPVAEAIWRALQRGATLREVIETVQARFEVAPEALEADARLFIDQLLERGLLCRRDQR